MRAALARELPNVGGGPELLGLADHLEREDAETLVLLLLRDRHCTKCRAQTRRVADRHGAFAARGAAVAAVLPNPADAIEGWAGGRDLPFPLLADPEATAGEAFDQPMRFGALGRIHDFVGRMPEALVIDAGGDDPAVAWSHEGTSFGDRPSVDEMLAVVEHVAAGEAEA